MYEEQVSEIRNNADHYMTVPGEDGLVHLLTDAADAIEELSEFADTVKSFKAGGWYMQRSKADAYGASIETRPLPEPPKEEA